MRQDAIDLYNKLTAEWNKKPQNLEKCTELLSHLKVNLISIIICIFKLQMFFFFVDQIILTEMGFIPAQGSKIDKKELHLARKYSVLKSIF